MSNAKQFSKWFYLIRICIISHMSLSKEGALKIEDIEATLNFPELIRKWTRDSAEVEGRLKVVNELDELVDLLRASNLRAILARLRGLPEWEDKWFTLKYALLIRALEIRANGVEGIYVRQYVSKEAVSDDNRERLKFIFDVLPHPYGTRVAISSLTRIILSEELTELIGESDTHIKPQRRKSKKGTHYFSGIRNSILPFNRTSH